MFLSTYIGCNMAKDTVTNRDLYDRLDRFEDRFMARLDKQDIRIDKVESFQDRIIGISFVFTSFVGLVSTYIWRKVVGD